MRCLQRTDTGGDWLPWQYNLETDTPILSYIPRSVTILPPDTYYNTEKYHRCYLLEFNLLMVLLVLIESLVICLQLSLVPGPLKAT